MKKITLTVLMLIIAIVVKAQYREVSLPDAPKQSNYKSYEFEDKGFWFAVEGGGGSSVMANHTNIQYINATWTGGYRLNEYIRFGAGLGVRYYVNNAYVRNTNNKFGVPIFANIRGNFISAYDRDGVPFWSLNIGGITNEGFFASPTIGYSFGGIRNNFLIGISYYIVNFEDFNKDDMIYSYFGLKIGYEF